MACCAVGCRSSDREGYGLPRPFYGKHRKRVGQALPCASREEPAKQMLGYGNPPYPNIVSGSVCRPELPPSAILKNITSDTSLPLLSTYGGRACPALSLEFLHFSPLPWGGERSEPGEGLFSSSKINPRSDQNVQT